MKASCEDCGDVELSLPELSLRVCLNDGQGTYAFDCPLCELRVTKPADETVIQVLLSAGVELETWTLPAELTERRPTGGPITHDDMLEFHLGFEEPDWFANLAGSVTL